MRAAGFLGTEGTAGAIFVRFTCIFFVIADIDDTAATTFALAIKEAKTIFIVPAR